MTDRGGEYRIKDEALSVLVDMWRRWDVAHVSKTEKPSDQFDVRMSDITERAEELDANEYDLTGAHFQDYLPERRQGLLAEYCRTFDQESGTIEEGIKYSERLAQIRDEFGLKDPLKVLQDIAEQKGNRGL